MRQSRALQNARAIAGLIAAVALIVKAFQDLHSGWPLLLVAAVLLAALALRRFVYRD